MILFSPPVSSRLLPRRQYAEEISCRFQIRRLEPFGKAVVDLPKKRQRVAAPPLIAQYPRENRSRTQFQGKGVLPARQIERLPEVHLGCGGRSVCGLQQKELTFDVQRLG